MRVVDACAIGQHGVWLWEVWVRCGKHVMRGVLGMGRVGGRKRKGGSERKSVRMGGRNALNYPL